MLTTLDDIQKKINSISFQKFTINADMSITPDDRAENDLNYMKKCFLDSSLKRKRVLDIGSSLGLYSIYCAKECADVVGIEMESKAHQISKEVAEFLGLDIDFREQAFDESIVKEKRYDIIIICSVYHYMFRDYLDHEKIFKMLYATGADIFFENPMDMTDISCNEFFDWAMKDKKDWYTYKKIKKAAEEYFELDYLGKHINGTRYIYWMKRKKPIYEDGIYSLYKIYCDDNVYVDKIEMSNGKFYCRKILKKYSELNLPQLLSAYNIYYEKIKDIEQVVKVKSVKFYDDTKVVIITEFLEDYEVAARKEFSNKEKDEILLKMMNVFRELLKRGFFIKDFGIWNFMIDRDMNLKLIDLDYLTKLRDYYSDGNVEKKNELNFYFMKHMTALLRDW